jgi:modulator of FtsH protease HflK
MEALNPTLPLQHSDKAPPPVNPWGAPPPRGLPPSSGRSGGGGSGGNSGGGGSPDFDAWLRRLNDTLNDFLPGGAFGGRGLLIAAVVIGLLWFATGFYTVRSNEVGLNLVFVRYTTSVGEGLRYNFPYPIGSITKVRVTDVNTTEVGFSSTETRRNQPRDILEESLMLTGDENIVDIDFAVQWQVDAAKPQNFAFNIQNPQSAIKAVAEAAMREVIGRRAIQSVLTSDRQAIEAEMRTFMQSVLDSYQAGVVIRLVQLQKVDPPSQVIDAFRDVQAARQDQDRMKNEAETYASRIVPEARGQAAKLIQQAEGYREQTVAEAQGTVSRYVKILDEYKKAPDVTRQRMYLETMERVLSGAEKTIIDPKHGASGVVPILPLNERRAIPAPTR